MAEKSEEIQISSLPGAKKHETVPTATKLLWTSNVKIKIKGWEGEEDQALSQAIMPERSALKLPPDAEDVAKFITDSLPSYGRGDIVEPDEPVVINGTKYSTITRKGIGSAQQEVVEEGEVYGTPRNLDENKYSAGFTGKQSFEDDRTATEVWSNVGMRVRQPIRLFKIDRLFMTSGSEPIEDIAKKHFHAAGAVEAIWATRNPITFEDAVQFFTKYSNPPDFDKLKKVADDLLRIQAKYLRNDEDTRANAIAEVVEKGSGAGEDEWFEWLSSKYGEQTMRKTSHGLVHGEEHRQNKSLGVESKDLGDVSGMSRDLHHHKKNYGSWSNVKVENNEMAKEIIKENLLVLSEILDLKVIFNVSNGRRWDDHVDETIQSFLQGMKNEDPAIYQDVFYQMYKMVIRNSSYFQPSDNEHSLYGISNLCFDSNLGLTSAKLPNTPVLSEFLLNRVFRKIESEIDPSLLDLKVRDHFPFDHFQFQYKNLWSDEETLKLVNQYNSVINSDEFQLKYASLLEEIQKMSFSDGFEQVASNIVDKVEKNILNNDTKNALETNYEIFLRIFFSESGLADYLANIFGRQPMDRAVYAKTNLPNAPLAIDTSKMELYIKENY